MFMERNYRQKQTNSPVRYCPLWDNYWQWGWHPAGMWYTREDWEEPVFTKIPEQGEAATSVLVSMTLLQDMATTKFLRLKGSRREHSFLVDTLEACSGSQARRHETKCNNWKKWPPPKNSASTASGRRFLFTRCHRHRTEYTQAFQEPKKMLAHHKHSCSL